MAFTIPTLEETHEFLLALGRTLFPEMDFSRESLQWKWLRVIAGGVSDNHAHVVATQNDLLPDTAADDMLVRWGTMLGVIKKGATPGRKDNALRVFGTVGAAVPALQELVHTSGLRFQIQNAEVIASTGYVDCDVVGIDTGTQTRLSAGEVLRFASTPVDLEEAAELQIAIDEDGDDVEQDGAYRARILSRLSDPPLGGAPNDYVQWALEQVGVAGAFVYPQRNGLGTVDVAAFHLGTGSARSLLAGERTSLQALLDERRPVGAVVRVLETTPQTVNVEVAVIGNGEARYLFDWDDATPLTITSWNAGTRTLKFTTPRPLSMTANDRIVIASASVAAGIQFTIESLSTSASDEVVLKPSATLTDYPPVGGELVYSGGPLVEPVRDAILAHINALGPSNPDGIRYGAWEGNVRPGAILRVSTAVTGVLDAVAVAPASTVEATDPDREASVVTYLVPGKVLVRRHY